MSDRPDSPIRPDQSDIPGRPEPKFKNPHRLSLAEFRRRQGLVDEDAWLAYLEDLTCEADDPTAVCDECLGEYCDPDGRCQHGCPSVLLAAGLV